MAPGIKVIIVGGGIGGLALAIMLEAAHIDYFVLERSSALRAMGGSIALNACSLRLLEQLGLWQDIQKIAKPIGAFHLRNDDLSFTGTIDFTFGETHYGYYGYVMTRPALFELLKSRVPSTKVLLQKTVVDMVEDDYGVVCWCSDGTEHRGDILVGADGAYSTVRENMYSRLKMQNRLPPGDDRCLKPTHICVLGVSEVLDPNVFPAVRDKFSTFELMLSQSRHCSVWLSPIEGNRISWCYGSKVDAESPSLANNGNWEKTPSKTERLLDDVYGLPTAYGCKVGDIINSTPKDLVSSVLLEEKFFETWHSKRVVLLGDACHKILPFAGQGAVHAMLDGVCLVNLLYELQGASTSEVEMLFQAYHKERSGSARKAVIGSRLFGQFVIAEGRLAHWVRRIALSVLPHCFTRALTDRVMRDRPQLSFLPQIEDRGAAKAWYC
ncbi:hypothetical protein BGZ99_003879 [Dissophora globulifera]|uniref:FAD-binding domain-containing protein n=1 Tax=Dissophora globulifera TaxID=979702 RepID=A0A9P6UVI4_9FUNG|nr:hypothetical protein BGZ99_003879 [Dissophora globulifera]